jgi:hypothetical protein
MRQHLALPVHPIPFLRLDLRSAHVDPVTRKVVYFHHQSRARCVPRTHTLVHRDRHIALPAQTTATHQLVPLHVYALGGMHKAVLALLSLVRPAMQGNTYLQARLLTSYSICSFLTRALGAFTLLRRGATLATPWPSFETTEEMPPLQGHSQRAKRAVTEL